MVAFSYLWLLMVLNLSKCHIKAEHLPDNLPSQPSDLYYIAGVVEFPALSPSYESDDTRDRINEFRNLIETASLRPDIIVFPENVLNNSSYPVLVPRPLMEIVPCAHANYDYIITEVSCYARSLQIYLLINVVELENCTEIATPTPGTPCSIYNTNVVFDRGGAVISRYRKYNLIGAEWQYFNYTHQPEVEATFETDFNVSFGHFTRMDLLYFRPAQALVRQGIANFLHPSKWQSELPFMSAMQLHQAWAYSNNVNLLVAGTNDPLNGHTGTGIYAGRFGALTASMTTDATKRKLYLSVVPKRGYNLTSAQQAHFALAASAAATVMQESSEPLPLTKRITGINLGRDNDIDLYATFPLSNTDADEVRKQICHKDLCCDFHVKRSVIMQPLNDRLESSTTSYSYRLAAFQGIGTFLNTEPDAVAVCAVFACVGDHLYSCARIHPENVQVVHRYAFDFIKISGNFSRRRSNLKMPSSVDGMLIPLAPKSFEWLVQEVGNTSLVNYTLLQPKSDLLTFGIYVNYFLDETIYDQHKDSAPLLYTFGISLVYIPLPLLLLCCNYLSIKLRVN